MGVQLDIPGLRDLTPVGQGGFGVVYRAWQEDFGRDVAVKVLPVHLTDDRSVGRFARERQAMGRLSGHPNIIGAYDHGVLDDGSPYLVLEFAGGGSLADRLAAEGPIGWQEAIEIGLAVLDALAAAHDAGVLHRDVKPENVLLTTAGVPKLADFGIARLADQASTTTASVTASLLHAAPELMDDTGPSVASDLYAVGSTLFTLMAGHAPFTPSPGMAMPALLARIAMAPPPDLREHGVPDAIADAVERLLQKDPALRPADAAAAAALLCDAAAASGMAVATVRTRRLPAPAPRPSPAGAPPPPSARAATHRLDRGAAAPGPLGLRRTRRPPLLVVLVLLLAAGVVGAMAGGPLLQTVTAPATPVVVAEAGALPLPGAALAVTEVVASRDGVDGVDAAGQPTSFAAANLVDGDPSTAWRTPGDGTGETLTVAFGTDVDLTGMVVVTGYDKADPADGTDRWRENRRVLRLQMTTADGTITVVELQDTRTPQVIGGVPLGGGDQVELAILASTEAGGRDYAAISEIAFLGR